MSTQKCVNLYGSTFCTNHTYKSCAIRTSSGDLVRGFYWLSAPRLLRPVCFIPALFNGASRAFCDVLGLLYLRTVPALVRASVGPWLLPVVSIRLASAARLLRLLCDPGGRFHDSIASNPLD